MKKNICILNYGSGNVKSVENLINYLGYNVKVSNQIIDIKNASHIILPGVGAYGVAMEKIKKNIPLDILEEEVLIKKKLFMGICVGMQILSNIGYENGTYNGLGWVEGVVKKLNSNNLSLPHIGWNNCKFLKSNLIFENMNDINDFYFLHSYVFNLKNENNLLAETNYGNNFCSVLNKENIYGIQFHPEKSQKAGMLLVNNFIKL